MRKTRLILMSAVIAAMSIGPLAGPAQAGCPDPDNPCTPPTFDPYRYVKCDVLHKC